MKSTAVTHHLRQLQAENRRVVLELALLGALVLAAEVAAQEVFSDGFASGTICAWSNAPSEFEVPANGLDDDCDGLFDEAPDICDGGLPTSSNDALEYAAAMDLCQATTEGGTSWGLISASLTRADGTLLPPPESHAIRTQFGSGVVPQAGLAMAILSTGKAAAPADTGYVQFEPGFDSGLFSPAPDDWLTANGGSAPVAPGCPGLTDSATAVDPVMLQLRIRAPGNARSFRLAADFLAADYPEWICSPFNDVFVVLLDSVFVGVPANPADKNLAIYSAPLDLVFPVGANLAWGDTGLFTQCINGATGCEDGGTLGNTISCVGTDGLADTGMDVLAPDVCGAADGLRGGGTDWLVVRGNVVPGEVFDLRLAIWDTSDYFFDSLVLLDDFQWSVDLATPGTTQN